MLTQEAMQMSRLVTGYANMLVDSLTNPNQYGARPLSSDEREHRTRVIALLQAMTPNEGDSLIRDRQIPERLPDLAAAIGLSEQECQSVLAGISRIMTEGLRFHPQEPSPGDSTISPSER